MGQPGAVRGQLRMMQGYIALSVHGELLPSLIDVLDAQTGRDTADSTLNQSGQTVDRTTLSNLHPGPTRQESVLISLEGPRPMRTCLRANRRDRQPLVRQGAMTRKRPQQAVHNHPSDLRVFALTAGAPSDNTRVQVTVRTLESRCEARRPDRGILGRNRFDRRTECGRGSFLTVMTMRSHVR